MKKKLKIKGPPRFEPRTSRSTVASSLIKNVNKSHYPYFHITCWLQSGTRCIERQVGVTRLLIGSQKLKQTSDKKIRITRLLYIYK